MSKENTTSQKIEKIGWYAGLVGIGVALLGIAAGFPVWINRTASYVAVGGAATVIGAKVYNNWNNKK